MIKVFLPLQAFPLGLIELHRFLSSITPVSGALRSPVFFFFFFFQVGDPHWDQSLTRSSHTPKWYSPSHVTGLIVAPGGGWTQCIQHIIGGEWHLNELTLFDAVINVEVFSSPTICSILTEQRMQSLTSERRLVCVCACVCVHTCTSAEKILLVGEFDFCQSVGVRGVEILHCDKSTHACLSWIKPLRSFSPNWNLWPVTSCLWIILDSRKMQVGATVSTADITMCRVKGVDDLPPTSLQLFSAVQRFSVGSLFLILWRAALLFWFTLTTVRLSRQVETSLWTHTSVELLGCQRCIFKWKLPVSGETFLLTCWLHQTHMSVLECSLTPGHTGF